MSIHLLDMPINRNISTHALLIVPIFRVPLRIVFWFQRYIAAYSILYTKLHYTSHTSRLQQWPTHGTKYIGLFIIVCPVVGPKTVGEKNYTDFYRSESLFITLGNALCVYIHKFQTNNNVLWGAMSLGMVWYVAF